MVAEPREEWVQVTFFELQFNGLVTIRVHTIEEPEFGISRRETGGLNHLEFLNQCLLWKGRGGELSYESGRNSRRLALFRGTISK